MSIPDSVSARSVASSDAPPSLARIVTAAEPTCALLAALAFTVTVSAASPNVSSTVVSVAVADELPAASVRVVGTSV